LTIDNAKCAITKACRFDPSTTRNQQIAVALVLDRYDLLEQAWGSILKSIDRLGPEWTQAALRVQRTTLSPASCRLRCRPVTSSAAACRRENQRPTSRSLLYAEK